jgi:hypothetical protein
LEKDYHVKRPWLVRRSRGRAAHFFSKEGKRYKNHLGITKIKKDYDVYMRNRLSGQIIGLIITFFPELFLSDSPLMLP